MERMNDSLFLKRCIELAQSGLGKTAPNPMVGSVIVKDNKVIGEGWHKKYGSLHAEEEAILDAKKNIQDLSGSTLFVNLEPCAHYGKRPPCTGLIISEGIKTVVFSNRDPNPHVKGGGSEILRGSGVEVREGERAEEGHFLNRRFFTFHQQQRPYVILKWAQTADGFMALPDGTERLRITSGESDRLVHQWRSQEQAIFVGPGTVRADNPLLTVRLVEGKSPLRVVVDRFGKLDPLSRIFNKDAKTLVFTDKKIKVPEGVQSQELEEQAFSNLIPNVLFGLYLRDIQSVFVEGGKQMLGNFIRAGLWDEARVFTSSQKAGKGLQAPEIDTPIARTEKVGTDQLDFFFKTGKCFF